MSNTPGIDGFLQWLASEIEDELVQQGHKVGSGDWLGSDIDRKVIEQGDTLRLQLWMRDYARYVDRGVAKENIPFTPPSGRGGTSKYISALEQWAARRGMDNPLRAAFAIAHKHKQEGMPTAKSRKFSTTGKRTDFLNDAVTRNEDTIEQKLFILFGDMIEKQMNNIFENEQRAVSQS